MHKAKNTTIVLLAFQIFSILGISAQVPLGPGQVPWYYSDIFAGFSWNHRANVCNSGPGGSALMQAMGYSSYLSEVRFVDSTATMGWGGTVNDDMRYGCITRDHRVWMASSKQVLITTDHGIILGSFAVTSDSIKGLEEDGSGNVLVLIKTSNGFKVGKASSNGTFLWWKSVALPGPSNARRISRVGALHYIVSAPPYLVRLDASGNVATAFHLGPHTEAAVDNNLHLSFVRASRDTVYVTRATSTGLILSRVWLKYTQPPPLGPGTERAYTYVGLSPDNSSGGLVLGGSTTYTTPGSPFCPTLPHSWSENWLLRVSGTGALLDWSIPFYITIGGEMTDLHIGSYGYIEVVGNTIGAQAPCWSPLRDCAALRLPQSNSLVNGCAGTITPIPFLTGNLSFSGSLPSVPVVSSVSSQSIGPSNLSPFLGSFATNLDCRKCTAPTVSFTYSINGLTASFQDNATNFQNIMWDFGDGNTSTQTDPTHNYALPGNYTVCVTASSSCSTATACLQVIVQCTTNVPPAPPSISNSGPTTFCAGDSVILTSSATQGNHWFPTGDTTQSIVARSSGSYSVYQTSSAGCISGTSAAINVTVNPRPPVPTINPSGNAVMCPGGTITLQSSALSGNIWSPGGQTSSSIVVNAPGTYQVSVTNSNGCTSTSLLTQVAYQSTPTISLSGPTTFCQGTALTLTSSATNGNVWSPGGQTSQSLNVFSSGSYSLTSMLPGCTSAVAGPINVIVNPNPYPTISYGGSTDICQGSSKILTCGTAPNYHWSTGDTTQSITVSNPGIYRVSVTWANGCTRSNEVSIQVRPPTQAFIYPFDTVATCFGAGPLTLHSGSASAYLWNTGSTAQSISVNSTGSYTVTVTDQNGCTGVSSPTVIVQDSLPAPIITSPANSICPGATIYLTSSYATGNIWSPGGQTTQAIPITSAGTYTVRAIVQGCTSAVSQPKVITALPAPIPSISSSGPLVLCQGDSIILTSTPGQFYWWSTGETTQSIVVSSAGSYRVLVYYSNGCYRYSPYTNVTNAPLPPMPVLTASGPAAFCQGGSVTLSCSPATAYLWSSGATTQAINANATGSYAVTVTDANGCTAASATTIVTVNPNPAVPTVTASGSTSFCQGGSVTLGSSPATAYLWSNGATTQGINVNAPGSYAVTVTDANGCTAASATTIVTVNPNPAVPTVTASGSTSFCQGGSVSLSSNPATQYLWSSGATTQAINVYATGSYAVTVTDANGCTAASAPTIVTVNPNPAVPTVTSSGSTSFCQGDSVILISSPSWSYLWNNGASTQSITVHVSGAFAVTVTAFNGCSAESPVLAVTVFTNPTTPVVSFDGTTLSISAGYSCQWLLNGQPIPAATDTSFVPNLSGSYSVIVTDSNGCTAQSSPFAFVSNTAVGKNGKRIRAVPNPTDGIFSILVDEVPPNALIRVLNVWGQEVFRSDDIQAPIDLSGMPKGSYLLELKSIEGSWGTIILLR